MFLFSSPLFDHITATLKACFWHQVNPLFQEREYDWKTCCLYLCLSVLFTESQTGGGWKGLLQDILTTLPPELFKHNQLNQVAQDPVQLGTEDAQPLPLWVILTSRTSSGNITQWTQIGLGDFWSTLKINSWFEY